MSKNTFNTVPTDRENPGTEVWEKSGNFVGGQRKTECVIGLSNCYCSTVLCQEPCELFGLDFVLFILLFLN